MPRRRLALCGYQPSPAEKAAFPCRRGCLFLCPARRLCGPPIRISIKAGPPAKARPPATWGKLRRKRPGSPPGPGRAFCVRRGQNCPPKPDVFLASTRPKPGAFCARTPKGQGVFPVWARTARGILCYSMRRACRTKRGKGCAHKAVCGVCAVFGHLRHAGVQPDAGHHQPRLGRQRQGAKRDKPSAGRGPRPFVRLQLHPRSPARRQSPGRCTPPERPATASCSARWTAASGPIFTAASSACSRFCCPRRKRRCKTPRRPRHRRALFVLQAAALLFVPHCAAPAGLPEFRRRGRSAG